LISFAGSLCSKAEARISMNKVVVVKCAGGCVWRDRDRRKSIECPENHSVMSKRKVQTSFVSPVADDVDLGSV